ncbi:MAG: RluA family pseudouridine synthase [Lachnospiraceae bacterium]|nr:RluA family pseudouridine synthase [Lachnospiraceae bacterium]
MKEITVQSQEEGRRFVRYLERLLPNAGTGFLYKMLRKKNITLNHAKADGNETLRAGDVISVFFSDDTYAKMSGVPSDVTSELHFSKNAVEDSSIVYEDEDLMAVFKPVGVLSQKAEAGDDSLNEMMLQYLAERGDITNESLRAFTPGICNRLDRNTAGIVWFAKTLRGAQGMAQIMRGRSVAKFYFALVEGIMQKPVDAKLYLSKDEESNTVKIFREPSEGCVPVHTEVVPVVSNRRVTLVRVRLFTGKSHQIRSVCKFLGHPVIGDPKYLPTDADTTAYFRSRYHLHGQQLFAYAYVFPEELPEGLSELAGETVTGLVPDTFFEIMLGEFPKKGEDGYGYLEVPGSEGIVF